MSNINSSSTIFVYLYLGTKVAQILSDFWDYFEKHPLKVKTAVATFWQLLEKLGYFEIF